MCIIQYYFISVIMDYDVALIRSFTVAITLEGMLF